MSSQAESAAKMLPVQEIHLERFGRARVTLRAPVTGTEKFFFTVPKVHMQLALHSLEVSDTRGGMPRVAFPAPLVTAVKPLTIKRDSAWQDVVKRHQGAQVELQTRTGPVEGYLLGFQDRSTSRYNDTPPVALLSNGKLSLHEADSISALTFKGTHITEKLERYTSTVCRIHEGEIVYRIDVTASGDGAGEVYASYIMQSPYYPTYDILYSLHADDDGDKKEQEDYTGHPQLRVKCYAVIRNPLHFDIADVQFTLHTGSYRYYNFKVNYNTEDKGKGWGNNTPSSSRSSSEGSARKSGHRSPNRSRSRSLSRSPRRDSRSPESHAVTGTATYDNKSDTESDPDSEVDSVGALSETSEDASRYARSREWVIPDKVSLKEGESMKILLHETRLPGGIVYRCEREPCARRAVTLHNASDKVFESGMAMLFTKGLSVAMPLACLKPERDLCSEFSAQSGCTVRISSSSRRGEVLHRWIVGKQLIAEVVWEHRKRYELHNKEDDGIDAFIDYESRSSSSWEGRVSATFYSEVSSSRTEDDEDGGESMIPYSKGYLNWVSYRRQVASKQKCAIVVKEIEKKKEEYEIFECSKKLISKWEQKGVIGSGMAEKLRELADMKRNIASLRRTRRLHLRRLSSLRSYEQGLVKMNISNEKEDGKGGNLRFFEAVGSAEESIGEMEDAVDDIECELVKLQRKIKDAEKTCAMKQVLHAVVEVGEQEQEK